MNSLKLVSLDGVSVSYEVLDIALIEFKSAGCHCFDMFELDANDLFPDDYLMVIKFKDGSVSSFDVSNWLIFTD